MIRKNHDRSSHPNSPSPGDEHLSDWIANDIALATVLSKDNMNISFSIIMATYNRKHCIKHAIDSLLTQTYQNFELIVIDDGSIDDTDKYLNIIYKEEIKNKKIKYIKLPANKGAAFARNEGLRRAKYNWIAYLDTDNLMYDVFLKTFANSIEKYSAYEIHYAQIKYARSKSIIGHEFNFDELVQGNFIDLGIFVHSVNVYSEIGGFDIKLGRLIDWDLIIRYTEKYPPRFIEKVLLVYDDNHESSRISNNVSPGEAYKKVILDYYERIPVQNFIEKYSGQFIRLKQLVTARDGQITGLNQAVYDKDVHINNLSKMLAERDEQITGLNQAVAEREGVISEIMSSKSWRLSHPLRAVIPFFMRFFRMMSRLWIAMFIMHILNT